MALYKCVYYYYYYYYVCDTILLIENSGLGTQCVVCDDIKVNQAMFRKFGVAVKDDIMSGVAIHSVQCDRKVFFYY